MCHPSCTMKWRPGSARIAAIGSWASKSPRLMRASSGWGRSGGGGGVIERRHRQRNLFETVIGSVEQLIEGLVEPPLRRLDEILADEALVDAVMEDLAGRYPHSRSRGRPGTPGEVVLRMLVLKRIKHWSFEETERIKHWSFEETEHEVRQSLVYRHLARVYFERVPDAKTLIRLSAVVGADAIEAIHRRLVEMARAQGLIKGRYARVDTTVVETNIRYPTDSRLLQDGVRVLTRAFQRIELATGVVGGKLRDRMRATTHRVLEIARAARSRAGHGRERLEQGYRRLLATVRSTVRDAERVCAELSSAARVAMSQHSSRAVTSSQAQLEHFIPLVSRVM